MARKPKPPVKAKDMQGLKYLQVFWKAIEPLADVPEHGNRLYQMYQHVSLLLLHFFNPVLDSLRALQQATGLGNVQKAVGVRRTSLGSMSESAGKVFDPELMLPILEQTAAMIPAVPKGSPLDGLSLLPVAQDGSFLRCLPKMVWALFRRKSANRGVKLHLQLDVRRGIPIAWEVTKATASEKKVLRQWLKAGFLYLVDRGYIDYSLYQDIHDAGSFFVARLKDNSTFEVLRDRPLTKAEKDAGVVADQEVRMGSAFTEGDLTAPVRRIVIRGEDGREVVLLTNLELPAEMVGLLYRYRWQVELFFRWFKCILRCVHWLSQTPTGLTLQVYVAILASLLVSLLTDSKPTKSTYRMIQLYLQGWATEEEFREYLASHKVNR